MVPILYASITEGTVPSDFGLGALTDALECYVDEARNSIYELTMTYAAQGIHADEIAVGRYIKAQPNYTDAPQLFKIYKVGKVLNGRFTINAEHESYALSGKAITSGTANNCASACALLEAQAGNFSITTDKNTAGDFEITEPSSVRSWFGGKQGSLLDVYGGGEWYYNNFSAVLMEHRGVTTPRTSIRYGKNLTEFDQTADCSNMYTHVLAFFKSDEITVTGSEVATGLSGTKRVLILDASEDFETAPASADLDTWAAAYISSHNLTTPKNNFTLNFIQSGQLLDRVDLCDMVNVYFEAYGVTASVKCIRVKWDVLRNRYIETEFGDAKTNIADTIADNSAAVADASATASEAEALSKDKKRVFINEPVPPYDVGDLWTNGADLYYCIVPKTVTETGAASGAVAVFNTPLNEPLLGCVCSLPADPVGFDSVTITVANGNGDAQQIYTIELGETLTQGGTLNVIDGVLTRTDETTADVEPVEIYALEGDNRISQNRGNIDIEYLIEGFQRSDWNLASNYINPSKLEASIATATEVITGTAGGFVVWHDSNRDGEPDEILIMNTPDINTATDVWRWNAGGLAHSSNGYNGPYADAAITSTGQINASSITTGNLDASRVTIQHLTATMFEGGKISLGGLNDQSGILEIKDGAGVTIGEITKDGLKFYGAGPVGSRPYVLLNNTVGFAGYDANDAPLFWVNRDEFTMKKCVATNEISACGKIRMLPMTIKVGGVTTNDGIAFVALI